MTSAYNYATGGLGMISQTASGIGMFGTVGQDMINSRYGSALEENYFLAREQGMAEKDAYQKSKSVAEQAAIYETAAQIPFSFGGVIPALARARTLPSTALKLADKLPAIDKSVKTFARGVSQNIKSGIPLSGIVALGRAGTDIKSEQEGINIENNVEYINKLNEGSSKQAPAHFVERIALKYGRPLGVIVDVK